jgi:hypothetical protein
MHGQVLTDLTLLGFDSFLAWFLVNVIVDVSLFEYHGCTFCFEFESTHVKIANLWRPT